MRTLETQRLILRDWIETDLEDAFIFWSDPKVTIPEGSTPCKTIEECRPIIEYLISAKNNYAVVLKSTGKVIGSIGLNKDVKGDENVRNIGFCLAEDYWNQGLMSEALKEVIANVKEITDMLSATHNNNAKTDHLLKKFGFQCVDTIKNVKRKIDIEIHNEPYYILKL